MNLQRDERIERIQRMECLFDQIQDILAEGIHKDDDFLDTLAKPLLEYYESEQWKKDYESDERGELPAALKRGVLSEDGIYDLLCEIEEKKKDRRKK